MKGPPFSSLEDQYRRYLADVRALRPASIKNHIGTFRWFDRFLKTRRIRAARRVSVDLAYAFLEERGRSCTRGSMSAIHGWIRSILQFLYFAKILPVDLAAKLIPVRTWKLAHLPQAFSTGELARILSELRDETPRGHRERAVMTLFIFYGLRLGEVAGMCLDDIDWRRKTIRIRERKNNVPLVLPLLPPVEEALRGYLTRFRPPDTRTERLFVSVDRRSADRKSRAPLRGPGIYEIIRKFLRRCGLKGSANRFRHTLATRLVNEGLDFHTLAAILGHRSSDSTLIYAKVQWEKLREVAENYSLRL